MGFIHHHVLQAFVSLHAFVKYIEENATAGPLWRDIQQHDAMIEHALDHLGDLAGRSITAQIVD